MFTLFDRKLWSHYGEFIQLGIPADAGNWVYYLCVVLLVSMVQTLPEPWHDLRRYVACLPLESGHTDFESSLGRKQRDKLVEDAGDVIEAVSGLCQTDKEETIAMCALLARESQGRFVAGD
jgi:hypothetical protein